MIKFEELKQEQEIVLAVKDWFLEKQQKEASHYNMWFDVADRHDESLACFPVVYEECTTVFATIIKQTEKALYVTLRTGEVQGSYKGWKCWIPKSLINTEWSRQLGE